MTQQSMQLDYAADRADPSVFVAKVFGWMTIGLLLTAVVAMWVASTEWLIRSIVTNRGLFLGLILGELGLVVVMSWAINRISPAVATGLFLLYAAVNGLTLSVIFVIYTQASIASTFFVTAGTFGVLAAYGYFTKRDLTSIGNLCLMALIGLIIASVVNFFFASEMLYWIITYAGILIFVGLTAYDAQKIKRIGMSLGSDEGLARKAAIMGALHLYLDFINLFILLLRVLGRRR